MSQSIGIIENIIDQTMIEKLLSKYESLPKEDDGLRLNANTYVEQDFNEIFRKQLEDLIQKHFPRLTVCHATIYSDYGPGGIHTDGYLKKPEKLSLGKTFLIPLESNYAENATVIFHEESDRAVTYNADTGLGDKGVLTYDQVELPKKDSNTSKEFLNTYLRHLSVDDLSLTPAAVLYWKIGSAIYWPRNKFHASAWFPTEHNVRKAIVILTNEQ